MDSCLPSLPRSHPALLPLLAVLLLPAACMAPPADLSELNASYDRALARSAPLAADFPPGGPAEAAALDRLQAYFAELTPAVVADQSLLVYAPEAYLNDTLVGIDGAAAIRDYFARTVSRASRLEVRFLDVARSGPEYYIRWQMTVAAPGLAGGEPVVTYGVTHFRFDEEGRVLVHRDFWDAGTGLYEHLPGLGRLVRGIRARVEAG